MGETIDVQIQQGEDPQALILKLDGFEGPLELLLDLARSQKLDLAKISILRLVEQYLAFVAMMRRMDLEIAADYLVMAAWLTWLKSQLLLPKHDDDGSPMTAEEAAEALRVRLQRLDALRSAAQQLMERRQVGLDFFLRGAPQYFTVDKDVKKTASLYDLLDAYGQIQYRQKNSRLEVPQRDMILTLDVAMERLEAYLKINMDWVDLYGFLHKSDLCSYGRSSMSSTLAITLEKAKQGHLEIKQESRHSPIRIRTLDKKASL